MGKDQEITISTATDATQKPANITVTVRRDNIDHLQPARRAYT